MINPNGAAIEYAALTKLIDLSVEVADSKVKKPLYNKIAQAATIRYYLKALDDRAYMDDTQINMIYQKLIEVADITSYPTGRAIAERPAPSLAVGLPGPKGDKGDTGDTGPQGPAGSDGADGASALSTLSSGLIFIGNDLNVPVERSLSGAFTITNTGVSTLADSIVSDSNIAAAAGISLTKLEAQLPSRVAIFNSDGLLEPSTSVTLTELSYIAGASSNIQTQLNTKQGTITGAASTVVTDDLEPSIVLVSSLSGKIASSIVSSTALTNIANLTSDAQAQLDTKISITETTPASGDIMIRSGSDWINLPIGAPGEVLTVVAGLPEWDTGSSNGVPAGGTDAQFLVKNTSVDYDTDWTTLTTSLITDIFASADDINLLTGLNGTITSTELGYIAGLNSNLQTQLDSKLSMSLAHNAIWIGGTSNTPQQLAPGSSGSVLTVIGGTPTWQTPPTPGTFSGPLSSTDNAIVRFNGTSGISGQDSGVLIDDSNNVSGVVSLQIENQGSLKLEELGGTNFVAIRASSSMSADYTITLPSAAPGSNTYLKFDGTDYVWATAGGGGGGGSALNQKTETGTTYTVTDADDGYVIYFSNASGCAVTLPASITTNIEFTTVRADGAGLITHVTSGGSVLYTIDDEYDIETEKGAATWVKKNATDFYGWGSLGPESSGGGSGTVLSVTGTTDRITVSGTPTDPIVDIAAGYIGQSSITTLGTITTGVWNGTTIPVTHGGTGLTAIGSALQLQRVNAAGTGLEYFTAPYLSANQTITLSGDVTGSGSTSITATIGTNAISNDKFRQSAALSVVGRSSNSTGNVADIAAGTDAHVLRRSGTTIGFGTIGNASISDLAFSKLTSVTAFTYNGNTVASEKWLGTIDNFELPVRVNNVEVARFIADGIEIAGASEVEYTGNLIFSESGAEVLRFTNDGLQVTGASVIDYSTALTLTDNGTETHKFQGGNFRVGSASAPYTNYGSSTITFVDTDTSPVLGKYSGARRIYLDSTTIFRTNSVEFSTSGGSLDTTAASLTGSAGAITTGTSLRISSGSTAFTLGFLTTQGAGNIFGISGTWNPSSGANTFKSVSLTPTINTTGTYVGTAYGIDYNPTMTGTTGLTHYGLLIRDGYSGFGLASTLPTAVIDAAASTTTRASLRLRSGTAPTTPNDGDIWFDGTALKIRIGGVTRTVTVV